VASSFGAPESYTPKHLAEKILSSRGALEGERKLVTVLFADLKASMELVAELDPEEARRLLDPVLELMMEAVHHYEGTVSQAMGDGIMALFGAPLAHEDHAVRACYAGLRMQERIKRHAEGILRTHGVDLRIRVGLNSGEVVVRAINSDLHMDYSAIGRTTHLAARMEQLALPGSILVTSSTVALTEGFVATRSLGAVPVKGLVDPLEIYELTGMGPARTRLQAGARRGLTPFVGRDADLAQLRRSQQQARDGYGQVVAIIAEPGVGKSRLLYELTHSVSAEGWLILECAALPYGKAMGYLPVVSLLKSYFEIRGEDSIESVRDNVATRLTALEPSLEWTLPAVLALLGAPVEDAAWQRLDPSQRRRRILGAVRHFLLRLANQQPLLLIFEDLHWIDAETQALLDALVESVGSARIFLLVTFRPEYQHAWAAKPYYGQMRLDALEPESAGKLLDALLGKDPTLGPLKRMLVRRGNPFFLEETVRTLVETEILQGARGGYGLIRPVETIEVPATVQIILAARIDRLSAEDKRLLQTAAAVGRHVPFSLLRAIADLPDEALRGALDRLQTAEFLYKTGSFPEVDCSFKHALTQDVAYSSMLHERRRELHAKIVAAIELLYQDRLTEHVELLAHHAIRGELREKAVSYLLQSGIKSARRSAPNNAQACFEQALIQLKALPASRQNLELSLETHLELRAVLVILGETRKSLHHLREAQTLAETLGDDRTLGFACALLSSSNLHHGELEDALINGTRAQTIATSIGDPTLNAVAETYLVQLHYYRSEYERVVELAKGSLDAVSGPPIYFATSIPGPIFVRGWLLRSLAELGCFVEAAPHAQEMLQFAESAPSGYAAGIAHLAVGWCLLAQGEWAQARPHIVRGTSDYRKGNVVLALPHGVASSAWLLAQIGEMTEARSCLNEGQSLLERGISRGTIDQAGMDYQWLGRAAFLLDIPDEAHRLAAMSLQHSSSHPGFAAHAFQLLGDLSVHSGRFDTEAGEMHYRKALTLAELHRMRPVIGHCYLGLGQIAKRAGKAGEAREYLATATSMYQEMGMRFYLEKAEAEI
jgi:class 3 adenylate cyclase/tetratricopeptide (TPR) repeat protein